MAWQERDRGMAFYSVPFSRVSHFAMGPKGFVHHAWSDSLRVRVYDATGGRQRTVELPFQAIPVTDDERDAALGNRSGEARSLVQDRMPKTKPAFNHFLVDDEGRYWFGRPTTHPDTTAWWVANPEAKRIVTARLPSAIQFMTVQDGFAYGRSQTETGAPVLVRYRIRSGP